VTQGNSGFISELLDELGRREEIARWRRVVRMAARCDDTGHFPFSHASEHLVLKGRGHEWMSRSACTLLRGRLRLGNERVRHGEILSLVGLIVEDTYLDAVLSGARRLGPRSTKESSMSDVTLEVEQYPYAPDGTVINSRLPLLVYRQAVKADEGGDLEAALKQTFSGNDWLNNWTYRGVYPYPHFHTTCHEVLGVARGAMPLRLGGAAQEPMLFTAGDVIVVPAGVSHSAFEEAEHATLGGTDDVLMVGGYADGRDWDLMRDGQVSDGEMRAAVKRIMGLPIPRLDPVTGGPMHPWRDAQSSLEWGQGVGMSTGIEDVHK